MCAFVAIGRGEFLVCMTRHKDWRAILTSEILHSADIAQKTARKLPDPNGVGSILKESSSFLVNCFSLDQWRGALLTNADEAHPGVAH